MNKVIIFDLDDTLFLEKDFVISGFASVADYVRKEKKVEGFYQHCLDLFNKGVRGNIFNLAAKELAIVYDDQFIMELIEIYRFHKPIIKLLTDAKWALDYFYHKYPLALITDGYAQMQKNKIAALNIGHFFDLLVYSDEKGIEFRKPNEWPYLQVQNYYRSNIDSCKFVYVADNVTKDFITPKKMGWLTIQIQRLDGEYCSKIAQSEEYKAEHIITSLFNLEKIL